MAILSSTVFTAWIMFQGRPRVQMKLHGIAMIQQNVFGSDQTQTGQKHDVSVLFLFYFLSLARLLDKEGPQNICFNTYTCEIAFWLNLYHIGAKKVVSPVFMSSWRHWVSMTHRNYFKFSVIYVISKSINSKVLCVRYIRPLKHPFLPLRLVWASLARFIPRN